VHEVYKKTYIFKGLDHRKARWGWNFYKSESTGVELFLEKKRRLSAPVSTVNIIHCFSDSTALS
jgi:hypothetical protein